ncbi:MAG: hypothetical protein ACJ79V_02400 [Myxococcales bacterium]
MAKDGPHELRYMRTGPVIENYETVPSATLRKVDFGQGGVGKLQSLANIRVTIAVFFLLCCGHVSLLPDRDRIAPKTTIVRLVPRRWVLFVSSSCTVFL